MCGQGTAGPGWGLLGGASPLVLHLSTSNISAHSCGSRHQPQVLAVHGHLRTLALVHSGRGQGLSFPWLLSRRNPFVGHPDSWHSLWVPGTILGHFTMWPCDSDQVWNTHPPPSITEPPCDLGQAPCPILSSVGEVSGTSTVVYIVGGRWLGRGCVSRTSLAFGVRSAL